MYTFHPSVDCQYTDDCLANGSLNIGGDGNYTEEFKEGGGGYLHR